jgi:hypothetical protein
MIVQPAPATKIDSQPTFEELCRALAAGHLPTRFYQLLHLALPIGVQLWLWGWPRLALLMFTVTAFAVWALCEKHRNGPNAHRSRRLLAGIRHVAAATAIIIGGSLALETFVRVLASDWRGV